jgi:hypothetical protein
MPLADYICAERHYVESRYVECVMLNVIMLIVYKPPEILELSEI